jgi:hypothetical protein
VEEVTLGEIVLRTLVIPDSCEKTGDFAELIGWIDLPRSVDERCHGLEYRDRKCLRCLCIASKAHEQLPELGTASRPAALGKAVENEKSIHSKVGENVIRIIGHYESLRKRIEPNDLFEGCFEARVVASSTIDAGEVGQYEEAGIGRFELEAQALLEILFCNVKIVDGPVYASKCVDSLSPVGLDLVGFTEELNGTTEIARLNELLCTFYDKPGGFDSCLREPAGGEKYQEENE